MGADFGTRSRERAEPRLARWMAVVGVAVLALSAAHAARAIAAREAARQEWEGERRRGEGGRARLGVRERSPEGGSLLQRQAELTAGATPPRVIADLAPLLPPGTRVKQLVLDYGRRLELELQVEARTPAEYDRLLEALGRTPRLERVLPGAESREGIVDSSLRAVYLPREAR